MTRPTLAALLATLVFALPAAAQLVEVPTQITYQGVLQHNGSPYSGDIDLQFAFYEFETGGSPVGPFGTPPVSTSATCTDGLFTTIIDPGTLRLGNNARWLEIRVRPSGGGLYETLSPRQRLTSTPFAVQARGAVTQADGSIALDAGLSLAASNTTAASMSNQNSVWQSFVAQASGNLSSVTFSLPGTTTYFPSNPSLSPMVNVYAGTGTGGALISQFNNLDLAFAFVGSIEVFGEQTITLNEGSTYTAEMVLNNGDTTDFSYDLNDPYLSGEAGLGASSDMKFEFKVTGWNEPNTQIDAQNTLRHRGALSLYNQNPPVAAFSIDTDSISPSGTYDHDDIAVGDSRSTLGLYGSSSINPAAITLSRFNSVSSTLTNKWAIANAGFANSDRLEFSFGTDRSIESNTAHMTLTTTGHLGLGTKLPLAPLHIATSSLVITPAAISGDSAMISGTDAVLGLYSRNIGAWGSEISLKDVNSGGNLIDNWSIIRGASTGSNLYFKFGTNANGANNPTIMQLDSSTGAVLLGDGPDSSGRLVITQSVDQNNGGLAIYDTNNSANMRLWMDTGNVARIDGGAAGTTPIEINAGGGAVFIDNLVTPSTAAIKTDIKTLTDALATLLELRGVYYTKKLNGNHDIGFIAEEMAKVLPEVVAFNAQGNPVGIEYAKITALTVEAIKQQQTEIRSLRSALDELAARLGRLETED